MPEVGKLYRNTERNPRFEPGVLSTVVEVRSGWGGAYGDVRGNWITYLVNDALVCHFFYDLRGGTWNDKWEAVNA